MRNLLRGMLRPEGLFVALAIPFGLILLLLTPPLQVPDEGEHFYRAYQISEGVLFPLKMTGNVPNYPNREHGRTGGRLPESLRRIEGPPEVELRSASSGVSRRRLQFQWIREGSIDPDARVFISFSNTAVYSPLPYLPQAAGILLARVCTRSVIVCFYAGRLANLLASVFVFWLAIRTLPAMKCLVVSLAVMPMSIYLLPSLSADAPTNALVFLFIAHILRLACRGDHPATWRDFVPLFFLGCLLSLAKPGYASIVLLYFCISPRRLPNRLAYCLRFALLLAAVGFCCGAWAYLIGPSYSPLVDSWYAPAKVQQIADNPLFLWKFTLDIFSFSLLAYIARQFIGCFGMLDLPLPLWFVGLYYASLVAVAWFEPLPQGVRFSPRLRLATGCTFLVAYWLLLLLVYITSTPSGSLALFIQGRYLIPISPLPFFCFAGFGGRFTANPAIRMRLAAAWGVFLVLSLLFVVTILKNRYGL